MRVFVHFSEAILCQYRLSTRTNATSSHAMINWNIFVECMTSPFSNAPSIRAHYWRHHDAIDRVRRKRNTNSATWTSGGKQPTPQCSGGLHKRPRARGRLTRELMFRARRTDGRRRICFHSSSIMAAGRQHVCVCREGAHPLHYSGKYTSRESQLLCPITLIV